MPKIDKNIPITRKQSGSRVNDTRYADIDRMDVGDSVLYTFANTGLCTRESLQSSILNHCRCDITGRKFTTRTEDFDNIRIWRIK